MDLALKMKKFKSEQPQKQTCKWKIITNGWSCNCVSARIRETDL